MKRYADLRRSERVFEVGQMVYLRLQPYRQQSVSIKRSLKLSPRFYGPFKIIRKVGKVAYELDLPLTARIHPVFHVSQLKLKLGSRNSVLPQLPPVDMQGVILSDPLKILAQRSKRKDNRAITEVLVQLVGQTEDDASWEELFHMQQSYPHLVGRLENLRPNQYLKRFEINGYAGVRLSSWVSSLSKLVPITISNCKWCQHIPPLDRFPLKTLCLQNLIALEYIIDDGSDVSSLPLTNLTHENLPKLKGWWKSRETVTAEHGRHHGLPLSPSFPFPSYLHISECPILMSLLPPGSQTTPSTSHVFSDLSKLKVLRLLDFDEPEYLPEEWLQNLTSLEDLTIWRCCKLRVKLSPLFQHLTALQYLWIYDIMELISNEDDEGAQCLGPTALHIGDLNSLKRLRISNCPNLISLPEGIRRLTSLSVLRIVECVLTWRKDVNEEQERLAKDCSRPRLFK
ncbi:putative disease resistance protein RGA1 [Corylus avellana]|uniref:putative disease resistance protein RGA1 n=1 Tax=Corylus avellana TaxID=13451 RepID=UPI00286CC36D|nr:putative disease resistance protein RGA1 [Corylus avellana]